jgi:hypothetical protein
LIFVIRVLERVVHTVLSRHGRRRLTPT